jgi:hypothetical protein
MTTLFIGDVHGCARELAELLERVGPGSDDQVVFVGDLVARGPDSAGVLRLLREVNGLAVRGNHEERLLSARAARRRGETGPRLGPAHAALMETLTDDEWALLEGLPLKLDLEAHSVLVVHAGVVPGVPWELQQPRLVTHIRSIAPDGTPSEKHGSLWGAHYEGPPHVVFGHNARRDVQLHPHATGLDTGCVYGGSLTGLVLPARAEVPSVDIRRDALVQVRAHAVYSDYGRPLPSD